MGIILSYLEQPDEGVMTYYLPLDVILDCHHGAVTDSEPSTPIRSKQPHEWLINAAAELARGPSLDARIEKNKLPAWALKDLEQILDRQKELSIIIRENTDKIMHKLTGAQKTIDQLKGDAK